MPRPLPLLLLNLPESNTFLKQLGQNPKEVSMSPNIEAASLSALVLSHPQNAGLVKTVLVAHGFEVVDTSDASTALNLCKHRRFDLGVYDTEINGTLALATNPGPAFLPRVTIGLLPATDKPVSARLHFLVRKPVGTALLSKTVKAAFAPIAADRRARLRQQVSVAATECIVLDRACRKTLSGVRVVNLSLTGMCLHAPEMLPQHASLEATFVLPGTDLLVHVAGNVVWAHSSGRCGVQFGQLHSHDQRELENWLDSVLPVAPLLV
jgi:PilZ domain-containing protein